MQTNEASEGRIPIESIDEVLGFKPLFEDRKKKLYTVHVPEEPGVIYIDMYEYSDDLGKFIDALYSSGLIRPFDWASWQQKAERYACDPEALASADIAVLVKLFTLHVRKERFVSGHLACMIDSGHFLALLRRLEAIRDKAVAASEKSIALRWEGGACN